MSVPSPHIQNRQDPTRRVRMSWPSSTGAARERKNWLVALGSQRVHMVLGSGF